MRVTVKTHTHSHKRSYRMHTIGTTAKVFVIKFRGLEIIGPTWASVPVLSILAL